MNNLHLIWNSPWGLLASQSSLCGPVSEPTLQLHADTSCLCRPTLSIRPTSAAQPNLRCGLTDKHSEDKHVCAVLLEFHINFPVPLQVPEVQR